VIHTHSQYTNKVQANGVPCGSAPPAPTSTCCDLVCFERPRYFCGHLLTDADLSKEQRYVIEKQKLYHRTLHGDGVVCGLRLTCDCHCKGNIVIGEGYAIDDCGHDLVVCESLSFDVIGALRRKGWLIESVPPDPCKPKKDQPECNVRQCFYVTVCYQEEETDFTTPFIAGCRPSVTECEATRVRESVRFDLLNELPKKQDPLGDLQERIKACWKLFSEGPFAKAITDYGEMLKEVLAGRADPGNHQKYLDLFCLLRGYLLLYLNKHPDLYNCTIEEDIRNLIFPDKPGDIRDPAGKPTDEQNYRNEVKDIFCRLLDLAYRHVNACVLGEMVFPCAEPCEASCVVLGTVEVEHGRVVRVCNCPRDYIWSFASFFQVLVATIYGGLACEEDPHSKDHNGCEEETERICCREFKLNCDPFMSRLTTNHLNSTALPDAISMIERALRHAFDFTRPDVFSPKIFLGKNTKDAYRLIEEMNLQGNIEDAPAQAPVLDPAQALFASILKTTAQPFTLYQSEGRIVAAQPDLRQPAILDPAERQELDARFKEIRTATDEKVDQLKVELAPREEINRIRAGLSSKQDDDTRKLNAISDQLAAKNVELAELWRQYKELSSAMDTLRRAFDDIGKRLPPDAARAEGVSGRGAAKSRGGRSSRKRSGTDESDE
jgi:hypothetical protein